MSDTMPDPVHVVTTRVCPSCGRTNIFRVPNNARSHVICKHCNLRYEITTTGPRAGGDRAKVGSPTDPKGAFKYAPAASHADATEFRRRMRQYAKLLPWGEPCAT